MVGRRSFYRCRVRDDRTATNHLFEPQSHGAACERCLGLPAIGNSRSLRSRKVDGILPRGSLLSVALSPAQALGFFGQVAVVRQPLSRRPGLACQVGTLCPTLNVVDDLPRSLRSFEQAWALAGRRELRAPRSFGARDRGQTAPVVPRAVGRPARPDPAPV